MMMSSNWDYALPIILVFLFFSQFLSSSSFRNHPYSHSIEKREKEKHDITPSTSVFLIRFWLIISPFLRRQFVERSLWVYSMVLFAKQRQQVWVYETEWKSISFSRVFFSSCFFAIQIDNNISYLVYTMQFEVSVALNFLNAYLYNKLPRR